MHVRRLLINQFNCYLDKCKFEYGSGDFLNSKKLDYIPKDIDEIHRGVDSNYCFYSLDKRRDCLNTMNTFDLLMSLILVTKALIMLKILFSKYERN